MFLRFLLVSAVTCLGVDLPAWRQAASDVRTGCTWCHQQLLAAAQAVTPTPTPDPAPTPAAPEVKLAERTEDETPMPVGTDAFVADAAPPMPVGPDAFVSLPPTTPAPEATPAPAPAPEPTPIVATVDPDAAFQVVMNETLSDFAADLAGGATVPTATALADLDAPPAAPAPEPATPAEDIYPGLAFALNREADGLADAPFDPPTPEAIAHREPEPTPAEEPARGARLAAAMRLTGQAVHAWMSLLQAPSVALDEAAALNR
jgi:hypothetical protein